MRVLLEQVAQERSLQIDVAAASGDALAERAQVTLLPADPRGASSQAAGRAPSRISVTVADTADGGASLTVADDGRLERRDIAEAFEERARPLSGTVAVDAHPNPV